MTAEPAAYYDPATLGTPAHDDAPMVTWTEDSMLKVLWRHFASQSWAAIPQVTVAMHDLDDAYTGLSSWQARMTATRNSTAPTAADTYQETADRRIDMLCARRPPKRTDLGPLETLAIEVKVTRADFLTDVKNPAKQAAWRKAATRHAYATPAGLVTPDEVPDGCGLLAVKSSRYGGEVEWVRRAPYPDAHAPQLPTRVLLALMHRISSLEMNTRGWNPNHAAIDSPQELRAALQAARDETDRLGRALDRADGKAVAWQAAHALAVGKGHPCRWCGQPTKPLNAGEGWFKKWRHLNAADDAPCVLAETAELERIARVEYDAADATERMHRITYAHRNHRQAFSQAAEQEPWRAFLPTNYEGVLLLSGAAPADVLPEGADQ